MPQINTDKRKRRYACRGFTLIELSCAFAILTIGVFGVLQAYRVAFDYSRVEREYEIAHRAVVNEIEMRRAQPFAKLAPGQALPFLTLAAELARLHMATPSVDIAPAPGAIPGLMQVTARVRWVGDKGRVIERRVVTLVADRGSMP